MIDAALSNFLLDVPRAALIWLALLVVGAVALAGLTVRPWRWLPTPAPTDPPAGDTPGHVDLTRYAEEVAVAADRAATNSRRCREQWVVERDRAEAAWSAYQAADDAARRLAAAAALPAPRTPRTPAEYADRERYLHRAAMAAYWRAELPVDALLDVLDHRNGWDPRRHPVEQEAILRRVVRDRLFAAHRVTAAREQAAWRAAEAAAEAAARLRREALAAAQRAGQVPPAPVRRAPSLTVVRGWLDRPARWRAAQTG